MAQERLAIGYQGVPGRRRQVTQVGKAVEAGHGIDSSLNAASIAEGTFVTQLLNRSATNSTSFCHSPSQYLRLFFGTPEPVYSGPFRGHAKMGRALSLPDIYQ
ncbi:hypothetical protein GCM10011247_02870 [Pseudomonas plecoglossicida]|nr:hypothetical protein GCM10011247_02870 [Pseudomonas plecoglossicida]